MARKKTFNIKEKMTFYKPYRPSLLIPKKQPKFPFIQKRFPVSYCAYKGSRITKIQIFNFQEIWTFKFRSLFDVQIVILHFKCPENFMLPDKKSTSLLTMNALMTNNQARKKQ